MKGILTRKDFLAYLAMGGNVNFEKPIKLNRAQLRKLTKNQLMTVKKDTQMVRVIGVLV